MRGEGGLRTCGVSANENSCADHVTWSPNTLWRFDSIFNLWRHPLTSLQYMPYALLLSVTLTDRSDCPLTSIFIPIPGLLRRPFSLLSNWVCYAGDVYNLPFSHKRLRSPTFHPYTTTNMSTNIFQIIKKWNNQFGKGRVRGRGREGVGADLMSENRHGAWALGNPMPELT